MIAPGVHGIRLSPSSLAPLLGLAALAGSIAAWAAFDVHRASDGAVVAPGRLPALHTVAFFSQDPTVDHLFIQRGEPGAEPTLVASFPSAFGLHAHGSASPDGRVILAIHPGSQPGVGILTIIDLVAGTSADLPTPVDYLSSIAWSANGRTAALSRSSAPDRAGLVTAEIVEVDIASRELTVAATFGPVFDAAPVGYAADRLYVVAVDQSGSTLHAVGTDTPGEITRLSVGRTRDWTLHPDGSRLAFLDIIGVGAARAVVAKVLLIATGGITPLPGDDDHVGLAWRPGAELPDVGGPGGSLIISGPESESLTVLPSSWNPQGDLLLAVVTSAEGADLEVLGTSSRVRLAGGDVVPVGWVRDDR